jgi:hypothetical protein
MSNLTIGRRVAAIDEAWTDAASSADLTELQTVLNAVYLHAPLATPPPQPAGS